MNELIKITNHETLKETVSARELYEFLDAKERFSAWIKRQFSYGFQKNIDYIGCMVFNTLAKQETREYYLTLDCAKHISMMQKSEKGMEARNYFIEREKISYQVQHKIPQTYSEALMLAAKQAEQIESQSKLIEEQKPKADFYDAVTESKDAIDLGSVAKLLNVKGYGRNKLFQFLRDNKILMDNNQPYQQYIDRGYFRIIETKFTKPDGMACINLKTVVYQKGVYYIRKLVEKEK